MKDAEELRRKPFDFANAVILGEDMFLWHGNLVLELTFEKEPKVRHAVLHFHIEVTKEFPQRSPNFGFCTEFSYRHGAVETINTKDSPLKGM